jgi:hypothetical protein
MKRTLRFNTTQALAIALLWKEWEAGGHGLNEATIGDKLESGSDRYRLAHTFRNRGAPHPAWGTMIVRVDRGVYALREPAAGITE